MKIFLGFFVMLFVALVIIIKMVRMEKIEQENRLKEAYMQSMQEFYGVIQNRIEATRRYRHDLARHIQTLEWILKQRGESAEMKEYMGALVGRYHQLKKVYYCTDEMMDSVLLLKKQQCDAKNIPLEIKVEDKWYGDIAEKDMVGLMHNLLDNAIEANERISMENKRGIIFSMGRGEDTVWMDVKNYVKPGEKVNFYTKKANKEEHGIGIKIIDSLIEKYHGKRDIFLDENENLFQTRVQLKPQFSRRNNENE